MKRDAFRNRLKSAANLPMDFDASSCSSRFVLKLDGTAEEDKVSQQNQEELFKNEFERQYTTLEKLGEGCSSEVMKCVHNQTQETRAVKIVRSQDDEYIAIAQQEFTLLKDLDNPGVVKVFDCIHDS